MYFVQDNETDVKYDNNIVNAALNKWKCTDELSCICCQKCDTQGGGHHAGSSQDDGPPNNPLPLICSSIVCPAEEGQGAGQHGGSKGGKSRRKKRSSEDPHPNENDEGGQHGWRQHEEENHDQDGGSNNAENGGSNHAEDGGSSHSENGGSNHAEDGGSNHAENGGNNHAEDEGHHGENEGEPHGEDGEGQHSIDDIDIQIPEADPDFKTNAEFLQLLMRLDEDTRERIGHKYHNLSENLKVRFNIILFQVWFYLFN